MNIAIITLALIDILAFYALYRLLKNNVECPMTDTEPETFNEAVNQLGHAMACTYVASWNWLLSIPRRLRDWRRGYRKDGEWVSILRSGTYQIDCQVLGDRFPTDEDFAEMLISADWFSTCIDLEDRE